MRVGVFVNLAVKKSREKDLYIYAYIVIEPRAVVFAMLQEGKRIWTYYF